MICLSRQARWSGDWLSRAFVVLALAALAVAVAPAHSQAATVTIGNSLGNPEFPFRIHNPLDIAPFCWWSLQNIKNIYVPYGLSYGFPEDDLFSDLFADAAGKGYAQPLGDQVLPAQFNYSIIDEFVWIAQAMYQHHSTTYQSLVDQTYPELEQAASSAA